MRVFYLFIAILILQGCVNQQVINANERTFELLAFSQGKMREESSGWVVYEPGQEMQFAVNGQCVFNHQVIPCMWHGFILEYESYGHDVGLDCKSVSSAPRDIGNPEKVEQLDSTSYEYTIPLNGRKKIFVNPQYVGGGPSGSSLMNYTQCSVKGREVLEFHQIFHFPVASVEI